MKHGFPFLTYLIDSFTKEKAAYHYKCKQKEKKMPDLTVVTWTKKNKFCKALNKANESKGQQLESAMTSYANRIMNRLQFEPSYKIEDSLQQIIEYIVSIPLFIKNLIAKDSIPPFQVDLLIAVKKVIAAFPEIIDEDDDDVDQSHDEKDDVDPNIDHIGSIHDGFDKMGICYAPPNDSSSSDEQGDRTDAIERSIGEKLKDFRSVLKEKKSQYYDAKTYPHQRRFSLFVDRRTKKDKMTMFEPPNDCNKFEKDHVPEIGFEFLRKCVIPQSDKHHITAIDRLCGQLMTFMFNVDAKDEMRCYIVWNGQTMRFHGDHISQILPNVFVEGEYGNKEFVAGKELIKMGHQFDKFMEDRRFEQFYTALKDFGLNKQ